MATIERAIAIAAEAHAGQNDKGGAPYVFHPLRVMLTLNTADEQIVGVLHDVVEDCDGWTFDRLRGEGFSETIIEALRSVTKDSDDKSWETYKAFVRRAASNAIGRKVKLADLRDNCDLRRIPTPTDKDYDRIAKYKRAIELIEADEAVENEIANGAPLCACLEEGPYYDDCEDHRDLGEDPTERRDAIVSIWTCKTCKRHWLKYHVEYDSFGHAGRWAQAVIDAETAANVTPLTAVNVINARPWYVYGGSHYLGRVRRSKTPLRVNWRFPGEKPDEGCN